MRRVGRPAPSPQPSSKMALSMTCWPLHLWWFLTVKQRPTLAQERSLLLHFADCVSPLLLLFLLFWALEFPPSLMQVQGWASESARFPYMHHYLKSLENGNWGKWEASLKWIWAHFMSLLPQSNKTMLARDGVPVEWRPCVPPSREAAFLPPAQPPAVSLLTALSSDPGRRWPRPSGKPKSSTQTCQSREWWCTRKRSWRKGKSKEGKRGCIAWGLWPGRSCTSPCPVTRNVLLHHAVCLLWSIWVFSLH